MKCRRIRPLPVAEALGVGLAGTDDTAPVECSERNARWFLAAYRPFKLAASPETGEWGKPASGVIPLAGEFLDHFVSDRSLAALHGHPERYSATQTAGWAALVAHHLREAPGPGLRPFLEHFSLLLDGRLPEANYSPGATSATGG